MRNIRRRDGGTVPAEWVQYALATVVLAVLLHVSRASPAQPAPDAAVEAVAVDLRARFADGGRYMIGRERAEMPHQHCTAITKGDDFLQSPLGRDYAAVAEHPHARLLECNYPTTNNADKPDGGRGWVLLLAASVDNIAFRVVSSCRAVAPGRVSLCVKELIGARQPNGTVRGGEAIWRSNNLQFPVTGFVDEGPENCGSKGLPGLIGFRHGVTVRYGKGPDDVSDLGFCFTDRVLTPAEQKNIALLHRTNRVRDVGRIAALNRNQLPEAERPPDFANITPVGLEADAWQRVVRANEIRAIQTGYDRLMILKVASVMHGPVPPLQPEQR